MDSPTTLLSEEMIEKLRLRSRESLYFFAKGILGFDWLTPHIHKPLCLILQDKENRRIRVTLPRGWLKTTVCSIAYPVWRAINNPDVRILITQNTYTNAESKLRSIRSIFEGNQLFRLLFPELLPTPRSVWKTNSLCINRPGSFNEGTFEAAGIQTTVISRHYDVIIEDDTVAPDLNELGEENLVPTKDDIEQAIGWHRLATPLLVSPGESQIIIVGTRWFEKDLISWNAQHEPSYIGYERAAKETNGLPDRMGKVVWEEKFGEKVLEMLEGAMGPYMMACLYFNNPIRSGDMIFRKEWFKFYETQPRDIVSYTTVDLAGDPEKTKTKDSDYNVVLTAAKDLSTGRIFVLDYWRARANPGEVIQQIFSHVRKYSPIKVGIESVGYQSSLEYFVKERMRSENLYFIIEGLTHGKQSKNVRIQGLQPLVHSATLLFKPWMTALLAEMEAFPLGSHDDLIDCLAMQQRLWALTSSLDQKKEEDEYDPLGLDWAIQSIRKRKAQVKSVVFDPETHQREFSVLEF